MANEVTHRATEFYVHWQDGDEIDHAEQELQYSGPFGTQAEAGAEAAEQSQYACCHDVKVIELPAGLTGSLLENAIMYGPEACGLA